jgi:predicted exporter
MPRCAIFSSRTIPALWLAGVSALAVLLTALTGGPSVNVDVMALLPAADRSPLLADGTAQIQRRSARHIVLLFGADDLDTVAPAAAEMAQRLRDSGRFASVRHDGYRELGSNAASFYLPRRFSILSDATRALLADGDTAAYENDVLARYFSPQAAVSSRLIELDPLLLLPQFLEERAVAASGHPVVRDDYLTVSDDGRIYVAVIGELAGSPFSIALQRELMPLLAEVRSDFEERLDNADTIGAGALFHAAAGTESAIDEISTVGTGSLLGVILLLIVLFRSAQPFILTLLSIAVGALGGVAANHVVFGEIHLLTLVFGTSLVGISVDYSLHFFCERYRFADDWQTDEVLHHIFPGITLGLVTSLIGFAGLFFAPFPGMQGLAIFSSVGLCIAYSCVLVCYPTLARSMPRPRNAWPLRWAAAYAAVWRGLARRPAVLAAAALAFVTIAAGVSRLEIADDIRLLQTPDASVVAQETRTRELIGRNVASQYFLVEGTGEADYLAREEWLTSRLRRLISSDEIEGYLAISDFVPSPRRQHQSLALVRQLFAGSPSALDRVGDAVGLSPDLRTAHQDTFEVAAAAPPTSVADWLAHPVSGPYRHLWIELAGGQRVAVVGLRGVHNPAALHQLAQADPAIHFIDPGGEISDLFGAYRSQTTILTLASYAVVLLIMIVRYGITGGLLVMATPAIAAAASLAVLGFLGETISLFNIMALLLVLGIGVDYALFFRETGREHPTTLLAIALSSITTLLAFGLLAFSATTAIHAFGLTIAVGILVAFVISPCAGWQIGRVAAGGRVRSGSGGPAS